MTTIHIEEKEILESPMEMKEILTLIPHRYPFLMVDRVTSLILGKSVEGYKNISANEPCFTGHFPENPVFPGVLMLEALAQISLILSMKTRDSVGFNNPDKDYLFLFAGIENARFKRMVVPGDKLVLRAEYLKFRESFCGIKVEASVDGELACSAEILTAVKATEKETHHAK